MKICKLCQSEIQEPKYKYCQDCRRKWKKPRDRYYYLSKCQTDEYKRGAIIRTAIWRKENYEQYRADQKKYIKNLKIETLTFYGPNKFPACNICGNSNINMLALDHVKNDGKNDPAKQIGRYRRAVKLKDKTVYQTLCYNCNWKKHIINLKNKVNKGPRYEYQCAHNQLLKQRCISHYSNKTLKCGCCGENDMDVLCLDHVNNNGNQHRKILFGKNKGGKAFYSWLIKNDFPSVPALQVLCLNCNISKQ